MWDLIPYSSYGLCRKRRFCICSWFGLELVVETVQPTPPKSNVHLNRSVNKLHITSKKSVKEDGMDSSYTVFF